MVGVQSDAEDITQEVFLRLWQRRRQIDEDRVIGWLLRVTRNCCIDLHRKKKSTFANLRPVDIDSDAVAGKELSPLAAAEGKWFDQMLKEGIDRLHDPYKSILILREMHEMKYSEIAEVLDMPLATIKVYLHRARAKLRKDLINRDVLERNSYEG